MRYRGAPGLVPAREVVGGTSTDGGLTDRIRMARYRGAVQGRGTGIRMARPPGTVTADSREDAKPKPPGTVTADSREDGRAVGV